MFVPRQAIGNPFLQSHPLLQSLIGGFYPPQAMFHPVQTGLQGLGQFGAISPFMAPALSPLLNVPAPFVSPLNVAANLPQLGGVVPSGFFGPSPNPWLAVQGLQHGIGTGIGTVGGFQSQALPFLSAIGAGGGPFESQYFGGQLGQIGPGQGSQFSTTQAPMGFGSGLQGQAFANPAIACDPLVAAALAQQFNPALQQQLPIRPLIGPQQLSPFQPVTPGVVSPLQATDPYSIAAQAQLLAQLSNVYQQAFRGYGGNPWMAATAGLQGFGGSGFSQGGI